MKNVSNNSLLITIGCTLWFLHYYWLHKIAENDRFFSHLSSLERELTFRSEMAMYYAYYKDIIAAPSFAEGISYVLNDDLTEYPDTINAIQRFNIYPEIIVAGLYRLIIPIFENFGYPLLECWSVDRGKLPAVTSCEGLGEPAYFYMNFVFTLNGFLPVFIFLAGYYLSDSSIPGGLIAALAFFYNHRECTRVMWTPPLRESFAFPFVILQNLLVTKMLKNTDNFNKNCFLLTTVNIILLLFWQFSQFAFLTQLFALSFLYATDFFDRKIDILFKILITHFTALLISAVFLFFNRFLLTSLYTAAILNFFFLLFGDSMSRRLSFPLKTSFRMSLMTTGMFFIRNFLQHSFVGGVEDDSHIVDLIKSKLVPSFRTFHTQLYVCAPEFDFLGWPALISISETLLLPISALLGIRFLYKSFVNGHFECHLWYHFLQLGAYAMMALFIMRLKLFFTPTLCITLALLGRKDCSKLLLGLAVVGMSFYGCSNLSSEVAISNQFSNWPLESLINWIRLNTQPRDAFAAAMPTTAAIRASAGRPIANHPHYEDVSMRNRTMEVYTLYSRMPMQTVHSVFRILRVSYVIIESIWCENHRKGCALAELYDLIDEENRGKRPVCFRMMEENPSPFFKLVFQQDPYAVFKVL